MKKELETVVKNLNNKYIYTKNSVLYIKLQDGTITEKGVNGIQAQDLLIVISSLILELDKRAPCSENFHTLSHLNEAYNWQLRRTVERQFRGVEGTDKP